jgi:hypothetical protein
MLANMPGSLKQFVLVKARKSRGDDHWSPDVYDVCDNAGKVVGRIIALPTSAERPAVVLDDNGTGNPTISSQSRIFSDTRTGDGGF